MKKQIVRKSLSLWQRVFVALVILFICAIMLMFLTAVSVLAFRFMVSVLGVNL